MSQNSKKNCLVFSSVTSTRVANQRELFGPPYDYNAIANWKGICAVEGAFTQTHNIK